MKELSIIIDCYKYNELEDYLLSLNGVVSVNITKDEDRLYLIDIEIKYDSSLINYNIIKMELVAFLDIYHTPSFYEFDKHFDGKSKLYQIERENICCQYCYAGAVEDLYDIDGICKVNSNFYDNYDKSIDKRDKYVINIYYNPNILSIDDMKKIEVDIDI